MFSGTIRHVVSKIFRMAERGRELNDLEARARRLDAQIRAVEQMETGNMAVAEHVQLGDTTMPFQRLNLFFKPSDNEE
jgi:hypothetical protein